MRPFGNLRSQYGQLTIPLTVLGCTKIVFSLHTARLENPYTPQTHLWASDFHEYHSAFPRHPPNIPLITPRHLMNMTCQQMPTDANRHRQRPQETDRCSLRKSGSVSWHLLLSFGISCSLGISGGCLGGVWEVFGGIWVVFMEIGGARISLGGYMRPQSLQYGVKTLFWHSPERYGFLSTDHTETSNYQNGRI